MLHEYIKAHATSKDPIIILIVMAKKSMWDGRYFDFQFCYARFKKGYHNFLSHAATAQVSNCFAGTRVLINDESNPHIKELKKKVSLCINVVIRMIL